MIKPLPYFAVLALALSACGKTNVSTVEFSNVPVTEVVATHAIETEGLVNDLTFVPNDVAPWLGRLIITGDTGNLHNTDIEGRNFEKTGTNSYASTFGLLRSKSAGVFFAANSDNALEAFIETSDDGQFSSMQISGSGVNISSFCRADAPIDNIAPFLTPQGNLSALTFEIRPAENGQLSGLEYQTADSGNRQQPADLCINANDTTFLVDSDGEQSTLKFGGDENWSTLTFDSTITSITPVILDEKSYLVMSIDGRIYLFDTKNKSVISQIVVNSGLSIMGIDAVDMVSATQSNFGGGAFNEGLIAFANNDENRIVFISLNYLASVLNSPS